MEMDNYRNWTDDSSFYDDEDGENSFFVSSLNQNPNPNSNDTEDDEDTIDWDPHLTIGDEITIDFSSNPPRRNFVLNERVFVERISESGPYQLESLERTGSYIGDILDIVPRVINMELSHIFPSQQQQQQLNQNPTQDQNCVFNPEIPSHWQHQYQNATGAEVEIESERNAHGRNGNRKRRSSADDDNVNDNRNGEQSSCCCACHQQQQTHDLSF